MGCWCIVTYLVFCNTGLQLWCELQHWAAWLTCSLPMTAADHRRHRRVSAIVTDNGLESAKSSSTLVLNKVTTSRQKKCDAQAKYGSICIKWENLFRSSRRTIVETLDDCKKERPYFQETLHCTPAACAALGLTLQAILHDCHTPDTCLVRCKLKLLRSFVYVFGLSMN